MNIAAAVAGRLTGGAAKVSVLSSALFGSISGSASANVASTGSITLPAMRRLGYPRSLAGAVEAVASSGGQIMPPLMGAGAFVMVELTGVPYEDIMLAALPAALLYFFAVWMGINAFAKRYHLPAVSKEDRPANKIVLITSGFFAVPFAVLLYSMFGLDFTPQYAACLAIVVAAALLLTDDRFSFEPRQAAQRVMHAAETSGRQIAMIASIILCASLIIGVLRMTGLGIKITSMILSGSGGLLWPAVLLTALTCLLLGMEVPTTAAYVICVSVAGPALTELGLGTLQTHLFVFWFCAPINHHASSMWCGIHCRWDGGGELVESGMESDGAWLRVISHPAGHDFHTRLDSVGAKPARRPVSHGESGFGHHACRLRHHCPGSST